MQLKDEGRPLRDAMASAGLSIADLARKTRDIDPDGHGVSKSTIGHLVATGSSARRGCHPRNARLISKALGREIANYFDATPPR